MAKVRLVSDEGHVLGTTNLSNDGTLVASATVLGNVKIGDGINVTEDGTISVSGGGDSGVDTVIVNDGVTDFNFDSDDTDFPLVKAYYRKNKTFAGICRLLDYQDSYNLRMILGHDGFTDYQGQKNVTVYSYGSGSGSSTMSGSQWTFSAAQYAELTAED